MKKSNTSERLKQIMQERNLRQVDILEMVKPYCIQYNKKLGSNDLSQYVTGKVEPGQDKLFILGQALNVNEAWLMGFDVPKNKTYRNTKELKITNLSDMLPIEKKKIPLLGTIACGEPIYADNEHSVYVEIDSELKADFCLRCKGDSMIDARILDGDIVFIREQPTLEHGEIGAIIINDEVTLKRFYYYTAENKVTLYAENRSYPPLTYSNEELDSIRILGKAIAFKSAIR